MTSKIHHGDTEAQSLMDGTLYRGDDEGGAE